AGDATRVSQQVRETGNIDSAVNQLISIYTEAIDQFHSQPAPPDTVEELRQAADYLRWISPHIKEVKRRAFDLNKMLVDQSLKYPRAPSAEQVAELTTRLEAAETEIRSIKSTLGWRLLSGYGIIKHRYVLPAYGRLRRPKP